MAGGVRDKELLDYFNRAQSWDTADAERSRKSLRSAYLVAGGGVAFGIAATALYLLSPLKIVEPYVIRVDQKAGSVDVMSVATNTETITGDEAVRKYFLAEYVRSREAWIPNARDELYKKTVSMTTSAEAQRFRVSRDPATPGSPAQLYRNGETAYVVIRSVSFLSKKTGQVRFSRTVESSGSNAVTSDWLATIQFDFAANPTNDATRFYNPLGFVVTSYRVDADLAGARL